MISFTIQIAGCIAEVSAIYDSTRLFCNEYLCSGRPDFSVTITRADLALEREKSIQQDRIDGIPPREFPDMYLETVALHRKIAEELFRFRTLMFHGSVVAVDGVGYLFSAKSGTGKSTHAALWRQLLGNRAIMINDDKPMLRMDGEQVLVYGTPWNGKHRLSTNTCVPLRAICVLERSATNRICPIAAREALIPLFQQSNRPMDPALMPRYMELIDQLASCVRFYRLSCNMEPEAAQIAFNTLSAE